MQAGVCINNRGRINGETELNCQFGENKRSKGEIKKRVNDFYMFLILHLIINSR